MTTKATRDVIDLRTRSVDDIVISGTGYCRIDGTPIGNTTPSVGHFTNITGNNLTISNSADFTGATVVGVQSYYADLAEYYEADKDYPAGTVVRIGGDKEITETNVLGDTNVFGVISTAPAYTMNKPGEDAEGIHLPVVMVGRVPCRVVGPVHKGERLIAMPGGVAKGVGAWGAAPSNAFARSLVEDLGEGERLVEVVAIVTVK